MSNYETYVGPDGTFPLHPGDIQREHPDWEIGDPLPDGWHEVSNTLPPEDILIYPEFGEGESELNTAPIKHTTYDKELSTVTDDNGVTTYTIVWNPVTYDIVEEPPPPHLPNLG